MKVIFHYPHDDGYVSLDNVQCIEASGSVNMKLLMPNDNTLVIELPKVPSVSIVQDKERVIVGATHSQLAPEKPHRVRRSAEHKGKEK